MEWRRQNQSTWTSVTPVSKTLGTYVSGGIVADGSLVGAHEVDFPDAAFASSAGVEWVALRIRGVANMLPVLIEIELDAVDYQDAAAFGLSRIDATISSRSTLTAGGVRTELATELGRIDATIGSRATQTSVDAVATNVTALVTRIQASLFAGITSLANWLGAIAGKTADSTTRSQINATAAGANFNETTDSLEAIRDRGDAAWTSGGGAGGVTNLTVEDRSITVT